VTISKFKIFTAATSIGDHCLFSRILQTHERASHRGGLRPLCSGADPKLRTDHSASTAVPGFAVSPSISWRLVFYSDSGRLPVRPDPASPQLYDSQPLLQALSSDFHGFFSYLRKPTKSI